jgi:putative tricarboxylic transport membrane protein
MSDPDWMTFFTRPISAVLLAAALLSVIFSVRSILKMRKKNRPATDEQDGD